MVGIYTEMFLYSVKYGLATLNEILDVFGADQAVGYDIRCSHKVTIATSSISEKAQILLLQLVVDAFHSHAFASFSTICSFSKVSVSRILLCVKEYFWHKSCDVPHTALIAFSLGSIY
jgi:Kyakuja-Dileera-Zisupton transposase